MTRVVDVKVLEQLRDDWRSGHSSWHALHADALDSIIQSAQDVPELRDGEWATLQCERCGTQSRALVIQSAQDVPEPTFPELHGRTYSAQDVPRDEVAEKAAELSQRIAVVGESASYAQVPDCVVVNRAAWDRMADYWASVVSDIERAALTSAQSPAPEA